MAWAFPIPNPTRSFICKTYVPPTAILSPPAVPDVTEHDTDKRKCILTISTAKVYFTEKNFVGGDDI